MKIENIEEEFVSRINKLKITPDEDGKSKILKFLQDLNGIIDMYKDLQLSFDENLAKEITRDLSDSLIDMVQTANEIKANVSEKEHFINSTEKILIFLNLFYASSPKSQRICLGLMGYVFSGKYREHQTKKKGYSKTEWIRNFPNVNLFYDSLEWKMKRIEVLKRDNYTCQIIGCGRSPARQVHHINDPRYSPEISLDDSNLITLCDEHHDEWHRRG